MASPAIKHISPQMYLAEERASFEKHEYFEGDVVAMAGASIAHNRIVRNLIRSVGNFLEGKNCEIFPSDLRVSVPSQSAYTYPDATIICGKPEVTDEQKDTVTNPAVIFEVLSDSTRSYDTGKKFLYYQRIPSLKEYILIDSIERSVAIYQRQEGELWKISVTDDVTGSLTVHTINFTMPFKELYANV